MSRAKIKDVIYAVYEVLKEAGKPLHSSEIVSRVEQADLLDGRKAPPVIEVSRRVYEEIERHGRNARFVSVGPNVFKAAPLPPVFIESSHYMRSDLEYVQEVWTNLPDAAKQLVLQIVRSAMGDEIEDAADHVIIRVLPDGPKPFPEAFLDVDVATTREVKLPEEKVAVRQGTGADYSVDSNFGFRYPVRNELEGKFIVYAHLQGLRCVYLPEEMIHIFKAVKAYEQYVREVHRQLYNAYGREYDDPVPARSRAQAALEAIGLAAPTDEPRTPPRKQPKAKTHRHRGSATPRLAFLTPILQALDTMGGAGETAEVIMRVGELMEAVLTEDDHELLPSTAMPRWDNTVRFARNILIQKGLLKSGSPKGVWEMSREGARYVQESRTG